MKKIFTLALSAMLLGGVNASAQTAYTILEDLTASKIQNANFTEGEPVGVTITTYDYNMTEVAVGESDPSVALFGMQAVPGWTANYPSDNVRVMETSSSPAREDGANAKAAGLFAFDDESGEQLPGLGGGYYAPYQEYGFTGNVLGMAAVWSADLQYTQEATLSAGAYMMIVNVYNAAGTATFATNKIGFITSDASYTSTKETYDVGVWTSDTIVFRLAAAATGQISLGFQVGNYGSASTPHLFINNVELYAIDEQQLIQAEIDEAKKELLALIEEGEMYDADVTASQAVYNNPNATMEQVQAAIANQKEINAGSVTDLSEFFFNNPHFDEDEPIVGGICTYDYDCEKNGIPTTNYSMLPVTSWERIVIDDKGKEHAAPYNGGAAGVCAIGSGVWIGGNNYIVPTTMSDGSTEGKVLGFVTCWSVTIQYKQACTLPAGQYKLSMSYYNTGGTTAIAKNLIGFIADDGTEYLAQNNTFPVGKWTTEEVSFTLDDETTGYFTLGYKSAGTGSANMPHFFTDGISLTYVGTGFNPSLFALKSAITTGNKWLESGETFSEALVIELEKAIETAQDLFDADSDDTEANKAAAAAIKDLIPQIEASIAAYKTLETLQANLEADLEKYDETTYPALYTRLGGLKDNVDEALDELSWSTDQINDAVTQRTTIIKEEVQKIWDAAVASSSSIANNIDITVLFDQMAYTYSTSVQQGSSVPDKEWAYGDASNFKTQYGTAEVWNQSPFEVSRTLTNMPAGTYTIKTKGFYRTADNETNYSNYSEENDPLAFVFAGHNKTGLVNVATLAQSTSSQEEDGWVETTEGSGVYVPKGWAVVATDYCVPNSQEAAYNIFESEVGNEVEVEVSAVLTEQGDITFGVKADQLESNSWVIWYGFSLEYNNAIDDDVLKKELEALLEEFNTYLGENENNMNDHAKNDAQDTAADAENAIDSGDADKMSNAITALQTAFDAAKANVEAFTAYNAEYSNFTQAKDDYYDDASAGAQSAYEAVESNIENLDDMTTAEILQLIEDMKSAAAALKLPSGYDEATDDNGIDMTDLIINPSFETGDFTGWTYNTKATGDTRIADNSNSTYTIENADGSYVFNTWSGSAPEGGFYVSQVLIGLPAGTYELQALLASDQGNKITLTANTTGAELAMEYAKEIGTDASIIFKLEAKGNVEIKAASNNWFKADNFRLTYYGTASQKEATEISDIEAPATAAEGIYNLAGQLVDESYKGIVIKNGKKYLVK